VAGCLPKIRDCTNAHVKNWCCIHRSGADPCFCYGGTSLAPKGMGFARGCQLFNGGDIWEATHNFSSLSIHRIFLTPALLSYSVLSQKIFSWMTATLLTRNSSKTKFRFVGLPRPLVKINNSSLITTHSALNLGFIFDE